MREREENPFLCEGSLSARSVMTGVYFRQAPSVLFFPVLLLGLVLCCGLFSAAVASDDMRGPALLSRPDTPPPAIESSPVKLAMRGMIRLYQVTVSPVSPGRCGFRPSCSAFGAMSIEEYGPVTGVMMTADRLMRCNIWKRPGPHYLLLPDGRLLDPPGETSLGKVLTIDARPCACGRTPLFQRSGSLCNRGHSPHYR